MDPSFCVNDNYFSSPFDIEKKLLNRVEKEDCKEVKSRGRGISPMAAVVNECIEPVVMVRPKGGPIGRFFGLVKKELKETFFNNQKEKLPLPDFNSHKEVLAYILGLSH